MQGMSSPVQHVDAKSEGRKLDVLGTTNNEKRQIVANPFFYK